jgi:predicted amidohydrolase
MPRTFPVATLRALPAPLALLFRALALLFRAAAFRAPALLVFAVFFLAAAFFAALRLAPGFARRTAPVFEAFFVRPAAVRLAIAVVLSVPANLDCFRVSVVKSSAYRRRKQLTYKLSPTTRNRLAVIAAGGRSLQPFDIAHVCEPWQVRRCFEYRRRTTESGNPIQEDA